MGNKISEQLPKSAGKDGLRLLVHERVAGCGVVREALYPETRLLRKLPACMPAEPISFKRARIKYPVFSISPAFLFLIAG